MGARRSGFWPKTVNRLATTDQDPSAACRFGNHAVAAGTHSTSWRSPQPAGTPSSPGSPIRHSPTSIAAVEFSPLPVVGATQRTRADAIQPIEVRQQQPR